ncbi:MAG: FG-GAP-like repeat-containing protein, partial [Candidatus Bathyarchaeia archaeon]
MDVCIGDYNADGLPDIFSVSQDDTNSDGLVDTGFLVVFTGKGDGLFNRPLRFTLAALPSSIAISDINLDGRADVAIAEQGRLEVFTGTFLATGFKTPIDRFGTTGPVSGNALILTNPASVSVSFGILDLDTEADIVVAERGIVNGMLEVFLTNQFGGIYNPAGVSSITLSTTGNIGVAASLPVHAPRALAIGSSTYLDVTVSSIDFDMDIFCATTAGIEVFENTFPIPGFLPQTTLTGAGIDPVAVTFYDLNSDRLPDVVSLNRSSDSISVFHTRRAGIPIIAGYDPEIETENVGQEPVSFAILNFDGDAFIDVAVLDSPSSQLPQGGIRIFSHLNRRLPFEQTSLISNSTGRPLVKPNSIAVGLVDFSSPTDDLIVSNPTINGSTGGVTLLLGSLDYQTKPLQRITTASPITDLDGSGILNDLIVIEQEFGLVFFVYNLNDIDPPGVLVLEVTDIFTTPVLTPTSAVTFFDPNTGLNNVAITEVGARGGVGFGQIIVAENIGVPTELGAYRQYVATAGATHLMSGDFDGDGFQDLAYIDPISNLVAVALNDTTNQFYRSLFRETGGFQPVSAALADVNDDDLLDMMVVNRGATNQANQSIVSTLLGRGDGTFQPSNSLLQVPNFAISITGGRKLFTDLPEQIVDFNGDGLPDFAVVSTAGGKEQSSTLTYLLNRIDAPGNFTVQPPVHLIDDLAGTRLALDDFRAGPAIVSGRGGPQGITAGYGGANYLLDSADFNADGSTDLVVAGAFEENPRISFRSSIFLLGNEVGVAPRIVRSQRVFEYGGRNIETSGDDLFIYCTTAELSQQRNFVPEVLLLSINGDIWIERNVTNVLNHAPQILLRRDNFNAPKGLGRKQIVTAGETSEIVVSAFDRDGDIVNFSLAPASSTGVPLPSFITVSPSEGNSAVISITPGDVNRGPSDLVYPIVVEARDAAGVGTGGRQPLISRSFFTLVVKPNRPPELSPVPDLTVAVGSERTVEITIQDDPNQEVIAELSCDRGEFVNLDTEARLLHIRPQPGDEGVSLCTLTASDIFGLSASRSFSITVVSGKPPTISTISDQFLRAGQVRTLEIAATSPEQRELQFELVTAPDYVTLEDFGDGKATLTLSPPANYTGQDSVTVAVVDSIGLATQTSFNVNVQEGIRLTAATFSLNRLYINGFGFGNEVTVTVNGKDV